MILARWMVQLMQLLASGDYLMLVVVVMVYATLQPYRLRSNHKVTSSAGAQLPSMAGDEAPTMEAACQDLVEILDEGSGRLDMGRYVDHVRDLSAGAIATFGGTMRDHLDGRRVVELR
ncbi:molybdopterin synthase catalytic subunit [Hordeum vulgare]|nr:molybdopterin synthase catalytic subunit [Hordeum vulgare]